MTLSSQAVAVQQLTSHVSFEAEGTRFYPAAFKEIRENDDFGSKSSAAQDLASVGYVPSFPVVAGYGGQQQGQNRDKLLPRFWRPLATSLAGYAMFIAFATAFSNRRRPVIYTRYSCDLSSDRSNEDQEREIRLLFSRKGIDDSDAIVIHDRAVSGTTHDRPGFKRVEELVRQGLVSVIGVDDQARASRNDEVIGFVKDVVFCGSRFVSGDGVDTDEKGWKLKVRVMSIHHASCSEETAERVRRGMKGRMLRNKSVGDVPFGYETYFDDQTYAANYAGRGPRPTKSIRIFEPHAVWVREIFEKIADGWSFNAIANWLREQNAPVGRNVKKWSAKAVARLARKIQKYSGEEWVWGATTIVRDANGRKKQVPAPEDQIARVARPELRIIDPDTVARAKSKLEIVYALYGFKPGQKKRGPKVHYSEVYSHDILFKLLRCGSCGEVLYKNGSGTREYRQCKHYGGGPGHCHARTRVPADEARRVLMQFAAELLSSVPDWLTAAIGAMNEKVQKCQSEIPVQLVALKRAQAERIDRRRRLLDLVETGRCAVTEPSSASNSSQSSVLQRIAELDSEIGSGELEVQKAEQQLTTAIELPNEAFIAEQISQLPTMLCADERRAAALLGEVFDVVRVYRVGHSATQADHHELRFRLSAWRIINAALNGKIPQHLMSFIAEFDEASGESPEFRLTVNCRRHKGGNQADQQLDSH